MVGNRAEAVSGPDPSWHRFERAMSPCGDLESRTSLELCARFSRATHLATSPVRPYT